MCSDKCFLTFPLIVVQKQCILEVILPSTSFLLKPTRSMTRRRAGRKHKNKGSHHPSQGDEGDAPTTAEPKSPDRGSDTDTKEEPGDAERSAGRKHHRVGDNTLARSSSGRAMLPAPIMHGSSHQVPTQQQPVLSHPFYWYGQQHSPHPYQHPYPHHFLHHHHHHFPMPGPNPQDWLASLPPVPSVASPSVTHHTTSRGSGTGSDHTASEPNAEGNMPPPYAPHALASGTALQKGSKADGRSPTSATAPPTIKGTEFDTNPEALGLYTNQTINSAGPRIVAVVPKPGVRLYRIQYDDAIPARLHAGKIRSRPPDFKLGGICGEVSEAAIANLIFLITGLRVAAVDKFRSSQSLCTVWLDSVTPPNSGESTPAASEARQVAVAGVAGKTTVADAFRIVHSKLHDKLWFGPLQHDPPAAWLVKDVEAYDFLKSYLSSLRSLGPSAAMFPRHTVQVERWQDKESS